MSQDEPLRLEGITIAAGDVVPIKREEAALVKTAQEAFAFSEKVMFEIRASFFSSGLEIRRHFLSGLDCDIHIFNV